MDESAMDFIRQLGRRIATMTAETRSFAFLMQRLSIVTQRGNAVCVCTIIWRLGHGQLTNDHVVLIS